MVALVAERDLKEFRYGVPEDVYEEWRALHKRTGLPQVQILHRLIRFLLAQDQITQQMLLGMVDAKPDLIEFVLRRPRPKADTPAGFAPKSKATKSRS